MSKGDFSFATNLKNLEIYGNSLKNIGNHLFEGAEEQLIDIDLQSNRIEKISIEAFYGLAKLEKLSLQNNLISELQTEIFHGLINLKNLIMSSNKLF